MPGQYAASAFDKAVPGTQRHSLAAFQCSLLPDLGLYNPKSRASLLWFPNCKRLKGGGEEGIFPSGKRLISEDPPPSQFCKRLERPGQACFTLW